MKINNIDITQYNGKQCSINIQPSTFNTESLWESNFITPIVFNKNATLKKIVLEFAVKGSDKDTINNNVSNIIKLMSKQATYKFDGYEHYYCCIADTPTVKTSCKKFKVLSTTLYGYEYAEAKQYQFSDTITINNVATAISPAILKITSNIGLNSLTITGLTQKPITVQNIAINTPVVIDGEKCTIEENGNNIFGRTDIWEFPVIRPGTNTIRLSSACTCTLTYKPRYL